MLGSLDAVPALSAFLLVWNVLLPVGRGTPAGGISSWLERDVQAMVESVSPDGKMGHGERYCKVHFVPSTSQLFVLSRPLRIFYSP